ncbi:MAG: hypothetical protein QF845_05015 [Candidatus Marinimicrobia bacterium]|jgi:hypothetical protein|nr:hypothetical protein [Candidatus Neomarinimicrobiota bacterium]MDP6789872.1 hypothetical protein [Candidatus Neomarinimicrobiota bacterium]MDP7071486.1 hypothetical protein [Candidatus Neomarinimicrobiota bacterium]
MDIYHVWCNLIDSRKDDEFCAAVEAYLDYFKSDGLLDNYRITRRKLGFGPKELGEFHILIETKNMSKLEDVWRTVAQKDEPVVSLHKDVYSRVTDFRSALYRDFPDTFS